MLNLYKLSVGFRLRLIVGIAFALFAVVMWEAVNSLREVLLEERSLQTRHSVEAVHGVLDHFHKREAAGEMSREEAQEAAKAAVRGLRYGDGEYFFITDMHPNTVMHPIKPELDGKDMTQTADPAGKRLFVEFVTVVRQAGGGYVDYLWPKPGASEPQPKVSYVKGFAPWGWLVGTGVYVSDLDELFWTHASHTLLLGGIATVLLLFLSWRIGHGVLRQLGGEPAELQNIAAKIAERDLTSQVPVKPGDTRSVTYAIEQMQARLAEVIRRVRDNAHDVTDSVRKAAEAGPGHPRRFNAADRGGRQHGGGDRGDGGEHRPRLGEHRGSAGQFAAQCRNRAAWRGTRAGSLGGHRADIRHRHQRRAADSDPARPLG